jgi:hypothetical protein
MIRKPCPHKVQSLARHVREMRRFTLHPFRSELITLAMARMRNRHAPQETPCLQS